MVRKLPELLSPVSSHSLLYYYPVYFPILSSIEGAPFFPLSTVLSARGRSGSGATSRGDVASAPMPCAIPLGGAAHSHGQTVAGRVEATVEGRGDGAS